MIPKTCLFTTFLGFPLILLDLFPNTKRVKLQKDDFREVVLKWLERRRLYSSGNPIRRVCSTTTQQWPSF